MKTYNKYARDANKMRTLQQTLCFLQSINHGQPFKKQYMEPLPEYAQNVSEFPQRSNQQYAFIRAKQPIRKQTQDSENQQRKKMNKNRAIKRIMHTSLEILQASHQRPENMVGTMSSITQLHIYLKQYNRLLEKNIHQGKIRMNEKQEAVLENVYRYTVIDDYRDDKISKETFEIMSQAFRKCLVIIRGTQLKVYQSTDPQGRNRAIKLFEIQNVDYHSQPHIFTILTLTKDKSKQSQYLYFRFESEKNQNKWDRAIYCSFMSKKIKNKSRFFQLEYPPEKQHINISVDDSKRQKKDSYELNEKTILGCVDDEYENYLCVDKAGGEIRSRKNSPAQDELKSPSNIFDSFHGLMGPQYNQPKQEDQRQGSDSSVLSVYSHYLRSQKGKEVNGVTNLKMNKPVSMNDNMFLPVITKSGLKKQKTQIEELVNNERKPRNQNQQLINNSTPLKLNREHRAHNTQNLIGQQVYSQLVQSDRQQEHSQRQVDKQKLSSQSRKQSIQQKFSQGLSVKKQKLFFNKSKKIFLHQNQLQYWDYDEQRNVKSEKKTIKVPLISQSKIKQNTLELVHQNGKAISFVGNSQEMRDIYDWINLTQHQIQSSSRNRQAETQRKGKLTGQTPYLLMSNPKFNQTN